MGVLRVKVGTNWVDVGGSSDPVWVDPNAPTDPNIDIWYDTDASGSVPSGSSIGVESVKPNASTALRGLHYYATDTQREWLCDGTGWIILAEPLQTNFTPVVTAAAGTITAASATLRYARHDGWLDWTASISVTNAGTGAGGLNMTFPVSVNAGTRAMGTGREENLNGNLVHAVGSGTVATIYTYNNQWPGVTGCLLSMAGKYLMASRYT
jgi:hypothetical protein